MQWYSKNCYSHLNQNWELDNRMSCGRIYYSLAWWIAHMRKPSTCSTSSLPGNSIRPLQVYGIGRPHKWHTSPRIHLHSGLLVASALGGSARTASCAWPSHHRGMKIQQSTGFHLVFPLYRCKVMIDWWVLINSIEWGLFGDEVSMVNLQLIVSMFEIERKSAFEDRLNSV